MGEGVDKRTEEFRKTIRDAIIMVLGAWEDYWGMPRTIEPLSKKKARRESNE